MEREARTEKTRKKGGEKYGREADGQHKNKYVKKKTENANRAGPYLAAIGNLQQALDEVVLAAPHRHVSQPGQVHKIAESLGLELRLGVDSRT